jgi:hypothetical protein
MQEAQEILLFESDPELFQKAVFTDDASERMEALANGMGDILLCEILRYGFFNKGEMIGDLSELYQKMAIPNLSEEFRFKIFKHAVGMVANVSSISINALFPFICEETSRRIVSTAVIDFVSYGPIENGDPMYLPATIVDLIKSPAVKNPGAIFGALLHLGDRRLCKLLWPIRTVLDKDAVQEAIYCSTGFIYTNTIDFLIDWLEETIESNESLFGILAAGLGKEIQLNKVDKAFAGERPFPFPKDDKDVKKLIDSRSILLTDYIKTLAPKLYQLEAKEPPPKIMPHVLQAWGLESLTEPDQIAVLDLGAGIDKG